MNSNSIEKRQIRWFGLAALVFFGCLYGLALWRDRNFIQYFFGFLSILGLGFLLLPGPLTPVYKGWLKVAHFIGVVFTVIVLSLAYYLVMTPSGFIKRVFGGRPLPMKPDPDALTYWVTRPEPAQPKERFYKRF